VSDLLPWPGLSDNVRWALALTLGYPIIVITLLEIARALGPHRGATAGLLRLAACILMPTGAVWLILRVLAGLPREQHVVQGAETALALSSLYLALRLAQALLTSALDEKTMAPKLLLDFLRIGALLIFGAVILSRIWNLNLASLFAAVGVGSIVLGFALQEFLGNLLSGLGLLSAHQFGLGDWIVVDGKSARVLEMDWRTVTLMDGDGHRIVVANSTLAKGKLVVVAKANDAAFVSIPLAISVDVAPEEVRDAVFEAAGALPVIAGSGPVRCIVSAIANGIVNYDAIIPATSPGLLAAPRSEFLSLFWYVAQRRGIGLNVMTPRAAPTLPGDEDRLQMLKATGMFRHDADSLSRLAPVSAFRRYRHGDTLVAAGVPMTQAILVLSGELAAVVPGSGGEALLELISTGQLFVLPETLTGSTSPVCVSARKDTDVLVIPATSLIEVMERNRAIARDVNALAEARRQALRPLRRTMPTAA